MCVHTRIGQKFALIRREAKWPYPMLVPDIQRHLLDATAIMAAEGSSRRLSFKEFRSNGEAVYVTKIAHRLYWPLTGVFPATISVMKSSQGGLEEREPFCQSDGTWHEIASLPVTEPKVSSIEASICDLDKWEFDWIAWHEDHEAAEFVTYGDLDDEDRPYAREQKEDGSWEEDSDTEFLIRCCGQDRPLRKRGQRLLVTPSEGQDFVSIHDYVCGISSISFFAKSI